MHMSVSVHYPLQMFNKTPKYPENTILTNETPAIQPQTLRLQQCYYDMGEKIHSCFQNKGTGIITWINDHDTIEYQGNSKHNMKTHQEILTLITKANLYLDCNITMVWIWFLFENGIKSKWIIINYTLHFLQIHSKSPHRFMFVQYWQSRLLYILHVNFG